jgi:hypothetical protein
MSVRHSNFKLRHYLFWPLRLYACRRPRLRRRGPGGRRGSALQMRRLVIHGAHSGSSESRILAQPEEKICNKINSIRCTEGMSYDMGAHWMRRPGFACTANRESASCPPEFDYLCGRLYAAMVSPLARARRPTSVQADRACAEPRPDRRTRPHGRRGSRA